MYFIFLSLDPVFHLVFVCDTVFDNGWSYQFIISMQLWLLYIRLFYALSIVNPQLFYPFDSIDNQLTPVMAYVIRGLRDIYNLNVLQSVVFSF